MACKHHFSFVTNLTSNFGCNRFRITPDIVQVSKLLLTAIRSSCAVQFESEQTPCPWTGSQFRSTALHRIWFHAVLFLCHIRIQRPTTDRKIERSNGLCFGRQQLLANSIEIFIHMKKNVLVAARNLQSIKKTFWLLNYCKSGSMFSSSKVFTLTWASCLVLCFIFSALLAKKCRKNETGRGGRKRSF